MTTMKDGPGDDPFADDDSADETAAADTDDSQADTTVQTKQIDGSAMPDYPYVLRRDTVKDERAEIVAYLRDEYRDGEDEILDDVADEMGISSRDVSKFDLREAMWELAKRHPDEMAEILLGWGYDAKQ